MLNLLKFFAVCLASFMVFSSSTYACTSVLVLVRHAEDHLDKSKTGLDPYGEFHAKAYIPLFVGIKNKLDELLNEEICPFTQIISLNTSAPEQTAAPTANQANLIAKNVSDVVLPKLEKDTSALLVLNRQAIWGNCDTTPCKGTFLDKVVGGNNIAALKQMIQRTGSPRFNYMYVFKNQNLDNNTFNEAAVYVQLYDSDKIKNACRGRLKSTDINNGDTLRISGLEKFVDIKDIHCEWGDT